ncbi:MAG: hypothetical protein LQ346_007474 [Caloplaca aetnensis]|nr:MAG: hypothetical protein LQ346_007474 [Caloplaca aetnensis]
MSLRDKFGRVWGRSSDSSPKASEGQPATQLSHRRFLSEIDARSPTPAEKKQEPLLSPRKLHKAASTTFQAFSESLRSRAQAFYVNSNKDEAAPSNDFEPKAPKRSPRRSALWSSVRSRRSRDPLGAVSTPEPEPEPETSTDEAFSPVVPYGPVPQVALNIPELSLRDSQDDDDVTTPPVTPKRQATALAPIPPSTLSSSSRQIWPSPHTQLKNLSITQAASTADDKPTGSNGEVQSSFNEEAPPPVATAALLVNVPVDAAGNEEDAIIEQKKQYRENGDAGGVSDGSTSGTVATVPSTARTSLSRHPSLTKDLRGIPPAAEIGSSEDFRGTFWPATKVIKSSKRSSRSSTPIIMDSTGQSVDPSIIPADAIELPQAASDSSEAYEADDEAHAGSPPSVSMGPRGPWQEARARREKRYLALDAENTDVDSDFGEELTASPPKSPDSKADGQLPLPRGQKLAQQGSDTKILPLERILSANALRKLFTHSPKIKMPTSESSDLKHPVFRIVEYLSNKELRQTLLRANEDFTLVEDENTSATQMTVTGRLDPNDALDVKLAHFPCPNLICHHPSHSDDNHRLTNGPVLSDASHSDVTTASCTVPTNDLAPSNPSPSQSMWTEPKFVLRPPRFGPDALGRLVDPNRNIEARSERTEVVAAEPEKLQMEDPEASQRIRSTDDDDCASDLSSIPATTTPTKARTDNPDASPSRSIELDASDLAMPERGYPLSPTSSPDVERGRSRSRSAPDNNTHRQGPRGLSSLPSRRYRTSTPTKLYPSPASASRSPMSPRTPPTSSGLQLGRINESANMGKQHFNPEFLKSWNKDKECFSFIDRYEKKLKQHGDTSTLGPESAELQEAKKSWNHQEAEYARECLQADLRASEAEPGQEARVRLADISMVERRRELVNKARFNLLCKFIYKCEADAAAEETSSSGDESKKEHQQPQQVVEKLEAKAEESEDGYTTAMFQGE